ncbi:MAG: hypothetical protein JSV57_02635 [Candidatus Bathyarchaeota archaeon]|nr:MAG: hypothetical protein JSV57_02635 [Candidatus Bathyarchaeota archaeon]
MNVLFRRWDKLEWMKRAGYRKWGECPTLRYKDQTWYLTEERYLIDRSKEQA